MAKYAIIKNGKVVNITKGKVPGAKCVRSDIADIGDLHQHGKIVKNPKTSNNSIAPDNTTKKLGILGKIAAAVKIK